jgi:hypothetical protein
VCRAESEGQWHGSANNKHMADALMTTAGLVVRGVERRCACCASLGPWKACQRCLSVWYCTPEVGRCRLQVSEPELKARLVYALDETKM